MKIDGNLVTSGGGYGGDHRTPLPTNVFRERPPAKPSPTQLRFPPSKIKSSRPSRKGVAYGPRGDDWDNPLLTPKSVIETIVELYEAGMSAPMVAEDVGVAKSTVLRHLKYNGVVIRGSIKDLDINKIKDMQAQGKSIRAIARYFEVAPTTIRRRLS